ncbi:MAG: cadherin domain-containing protein [Planctomycetes bacterium]|nr:cadherin domain-containing protein [Planctomycetota bacterium]
MSDVVSITSSIGSMIQDTGNSGEWNWSYDATDDLPTTLVTITATDILGATATQTFQLTVNNVAPALTIDTTAVVINEGTTASKSISASDVPADTVSVTATLGTITADGDGGWNWSYFGDDDLDTTPVTITASDEDGGTTTASFNLTVNNVAPTANDASFDVVDNSVSGTAVGSVTASDPGADTLTFNITGGTGATAFAIDADSGAITVADETQRDFETTPSFTLEVTVTDDDGATDVANVTINLINQASITGTVFVDANQNGLYDANEMGIDDVILELLDEMGTAILDELGMPVTATTGDGGFYLFEDLDPGTYRVHEQQPTGVDDGAEHLGSLGGLIVSNDTMQLTLDQTDASDYVFAEIGQQVSGGDTATIGFWQNKHGQKLIAQGGTALAQWLTTNFGNVFGNAFDGASGADVANFYKDQLFKQKAKKSAGSAKVDAQFMAVALATYFTNVNLAGNSAADFGFSVTATGIGTKIVNVGTSGAAFDVADNTDLTIMQLLLATNSLTDTPDGVAGFASIYDTNGDGIIDASEASLRSLANDIYSLINEQGDL